MEEALKKHFEACMKKRIYLGKKPDTSIEFPVLILDKPLNITPVRI